LGVDLITSNKVKKELNKYNSGHVQFHRLIYLFGKDPDTVRRWINTRNVSTAFLGLCYKITKNRRDVARDKSYELLLLMQLYRKREIIQYIAKVPLGLNISPLSARGILSTIRIGDRFAGFSIEKEFIYDGFKVFSLSKKSGATQKVYKFVLVKKIRNKVYINIALDTTEERNKILGHISKKLHIPIARIKEQPDMTKFIEFLKSGVFPSFNLIGVDFVDQGFKISISPQYGRPINITENTQYKALLPSSEIEILESIQRIKILNSDAGNNFQVNINFMNYKNEDIIGGMRMRLNAQGLNLSKRESLKESFRQVFGFQLDIPLIFDVEEKEIYKKFLHNPPKKKKKIEIVSEKTIEISNKLLENGLLPQPKQLEETAKICTFSGCPLRFRDQWISGKICTCGNNLWEYGSSIITQIINEKRVCDFFDKMAKKSGYTTTKLFRDLVKRAIYPLELTKNDKSCTLIPLTTPLKEQQLEVLKYRYPNLILITSRDDKDSLVSKGFMVEELYSLVYELFGNSNQKFEELSNIVESQRTSNLTALASVSSSRILTESWYLDQKSLGAEFFEADTTIILNYIFKNSIWLGAKTRGQKVPDSISAFPFEDTSRGCFIADAKFTKRSNSDIGRVDKNKKYLMDGRVNPTIKTNGGLKGFLFTSNKPAQGNFITKMLRIIGGKHIKGFYLENSQILEIYKHSKNWENEFEIDSRKRNIFFDALEEIFLKLPSLKNIDKVKIWRDLEIKNILDGCVVKYRGLSSRRVSVRTIRVNTS